MAITSRVTGGQPLEGKRTSILGEGRKNEQRYRVGRNQVWREEWMALSASLLLLHSRAIRHSKVPKDLTIFGEVTTYKQESVHKVWLPWWRPEREKSCAGMFMVYRRPRLLGQCTSSPRSVLTKADRQLLWLKHKDPILHIQMVHSFNAHISKAY